MERFYTHTFLYGLLLSFCVFAGCRPDTVCRQDTAIAMGVEIEWMLTDSVGNSTAQNTFDSITVQGVGNDSVLYANAHNLSALWLPLRPDTAVTAFALIWHDRYDTLYIGHDNTRKFISQACGCTVYHTIDSVWHSGDAIDSIAILNSTVETAQQENLQLIMRP